MNRLLVSALAVVGCCVAAGAAQAQDFTLQSNYGDYSLSAGFTPDPFVISVTAGGSIDASGIGSPCTGRISNAPDVQISYSAGSLPLYFRTQAGSDTTLVVNGPDGQWYCDDDSGDGNNAQVTFANPMSGNYDVWVGTYSGGTASAQIQISEMSQGGTSTYTGGNQGAVQNFYGGANSGGAAGVDLSLPATYGSGYLRAGFTPDPYRIVVTAGGLNQASDISSSCRGMIARAPDYELTYDAGSLPLVIRTESGTDTTLAINGPSGEWYCDDDSAGNRNARVRLQNPQSGVYDIYVGTYNGGNASANIVITERE
jgi:hypothetical protein